LKVPRQCPLVLVEERLVFGICSIFILKELEVAAVGFWTLSIDLSFI
jgi:hypothetical protein